MKYTIISLFLCLTTFTNAQKIERDLNVPLTTTYNFSPGAKMAVCISDFPEDNIPKVKLPSSITKLKDLRLGIFQWILMISCW